MRLLLALFLLIAGIVHAEDDLLEPEKAFQFSAQRLDADSVEARFLIADGYYLYRDKIRFSADSGVKLGTAKMPDGKVKQDEYFGRVEYYRGDLRIRIPVTFPSGAPKDFNLKAAFQGCADIGVCYPPQEGVAGIRYGADAGPLATRAMAPGATPTAKFAQQSPDVLARLKSLASSLTGQSEPEFLPPDEAFQLALSPGPDSKLEARYSIAKDYYLYRDKVKLSVTQPAGVKVAGIELPKPDEKNDPNFGKTYVYHQSFTALARLEGVPAGTTRLKVAATYQGCSEKGICYPPLDKLIDVAWTPGPLPPAVQSPPATVSPSPEVALPQEAGPPATVPGSAAPQETATGRGDTSDTGRIEALLKGGNFWLIVVSFFGFGLLLSLTPCVFPMIPILSGIIVGHGGVITKGRGFMLSLAYVLGMAVTYALVGVAAGLSGTLVSNALQNPWALSTGAAIFVALALSMFGFFELQMPSFLQSRFTEASNRMQGGRTTSVFIMGVISALIVGPCVAAPLAGALLYISQTGDVVLGGVSLFSLAMGMGVPLLLVGLSAGALLPRAGAWMDAVKRFFGVALLAVAIWLISPLLSEVVQMLMWAALLMISAMFLHALEPLAVNAKGFARFWKGVGLIALVAGIAMLLGALGGSRDILQPLSVFKGGVAGATETQPHLAFQRVKSVADLDAAIQGAGGRPVMLDFFADWCVSCKEFERFTFSDPRVQARLKDAVLLQVDVTANSPDDKALLARFDLFGPPGIIFFDKTGAEAYRVVGYEPPEKFLASLGNAFP